MPKVSFLGDQTLASLVTLLKPPGTPLGSLEHTLLLGWGASPGLSLPGDAGTCVTPTHRIPSSLPKPVPSQGRGSRPLPQPCRKAPTHRSHSRFSGKPRNCCPPGSEPPNSQLGQNAPKSQDGEAEKTPSWPPPGLSWHCQAWLWGLAGGFNGHQPKAGGGNNFNWECLVLGQLSCIFFQSILQQLKSCR